MPRVTHVAKARKPNSLITQADINNHTEENPTASYYWWKFRYGGKLMSRTRPKASQLTQSEFLGQWYGIQKQHEDSSAGDLEELQSIKEELTNEVQQLLDEQEEKCSNMESYNLENTPAYETVSERRDGLDEIISELDGIDVDELEDDKDTFCEDWLSNNYGDTEGLDYAAGGSLDYTAPKEDEQDADFEEPIIEDIQAEMEEAWAERHQEMLDEKLSELTDCLSNACF